MSDKKLLNATAGTYGAPRFPSKLNYFQRLYETRRHRHHPLTAERLSFLADDLRMIALDGKTSFDPDFKSDDGTRWYAVGFKYLTGKNYLFAFPVDEDPKHHDGTVSAQHVALYVDREASEEELNFVVQAAYAFFHTFNH